jgi:hypothetical protein
MSYRSVLFAVVAAVATVGAGQAQSFKPVQAQHIDLGAFAGVAYYTMEQGDHRLVVTLLAAETGTPVRFVATLAPGQDVTLSVPRGAGETPLEVHFVRHGEEIVMNAPHVEAEAD